MEKFKRYYRLQKYIGGVPVYPAEYKKGDFISEEEYNSLEECERGNWVAVPNEFLCILNTKSKLYERYEKLQWYIGTEPAIPPVYKQGELASYNTFNTLEECELVIDEETFCFYFTLRNQRYIDSWYINNESATLETENGHACYPFEKRVYSLQNFGNENYKKYDLETFETDCNLDLLETTKQMFNESSSLTKCSMPNFVGKSLTDTSSMFDSAGTKNIIIELPKLTGENITTTRYMFSFCKVNNLSLPEFTGEKITDAYGMFYSSSYLENLDLPKFTGENITNASNMFHNLGGDYSLRENDNTLLLPKFTGKKITNASSMFYDFGFAYLSLPEFTGENITNANRMFSFTNSKNLNLPKLNLNKATNVSELFYYSSKLTNINDLLKDFVGNEVTSTAAMFENCNLLTEINLENFTGEKVTSTTTMFKDCQELTTLNLNSFNGNAVTDASSMFVRCYSLKELNLPEFTGLSLKNTTSMFSVCNKLEVLNIPKFDCSKITTYTSMFSNATSLKKITCKQSFRDFVKNKSLISTSLQNSIEWVIVG